MFSLKAKKTRKTILKIPRKANFRFKRFQPKRTRRQLVMDELRRQGLKVADYGTARLARIMACVMAKMMTQPLPAAVASCIKQQISRGARRR